jgi:GH35 family endo-1,4-beta-xylanase
VILPRTVIFIGTAVHPAAFANNEPNYCEVLKCEFNVLVAENMMKFGELCPSPNTYHWTSTDALVDFAKRTA